MTVRAMTIDDYEEVFALWRYREGPDPTKINISMSALGLSGERLDKELRYRGIKHLKVVFSPEEPLTPAKGEEPPPGRRSVPGSVSWVPPAAGLMAAGAVVLDLIGYTEKKNEKE